MSSETSPAGRPRVSGVTVGRIVRLASSEWKRLAVGTFFLVVASGATLVYPQGIKILVDEALTTRTSRVVDLAVLAMGVVFVVQAVAFAIRYVLFTTAGERIVARLREDLYRAILRQEIAFFDQRRTGELTSRLVSDTSVLQNAVSVNVSMILRNAASVIGGIALLLYTSPVLTALMLLVVPPVALGGVYYGRKLRKLARDVQDALARAGEIADESIAGVRTVRAFAAEPHEVARYDEAIEHSFALVTKRIRIAGVFIGAISLAGYVAAGAVIWYGGRLVVRGEMSVGSLTSFLVYTLIVSASLGALTDLYADFMRALGAGERVFELLDRTPAMPPTGGRRPDAIAGSVRFEGVRFAYPTRKDVVVLDGIDLSLEPDRVVALVGPSGAGKSTIASLLARLYDPDEGRIALDGTDVRDLDPEWLRRHVGTVAQEPILFSTTIADNIRYARPDASDAEVEAAARVANAHEFVAGFPDGYRTMVGERGVQLSGGQKQRVAIARAVLKNPKILVLDEATSALDAESEHLVKEALDRLMQGRTTLVIAHRLSTVADADRVVVLDGGKIVQSGPHAELVERDGLYRRLVERQLATA